MKNANALHLTKDSIEEWLQYLSVERNLSPRTISAYRKDILPLADIPLTLEALQQHLAQLSAVREWQAITLARKLSALRGFLRFLYEVGKLSEDWSQYWDNPSFWRKIPTYLTIEEAQRLIESYPPTLRHSARNRLLLELLYGAGLRVSEACSLRMDDIAWEERFLQVRGKGTKIRWVPFGKSIDDAMRSYLAVRSVRYRSGSPYLLLSQKGGPLTRIQAFTIVREAAHYAGIERPISPHALRHSYATHLLLAGMDVAYLQRLLGHASATTTQHYLHLLPNDLRQVLDRYHPRATKALK
ncbi:MAG: tyrosine-type recombinase/integrase [Bacteroidia bacterium]|nr:tyrosine-type recombinase/integrase [Bacteroidia bacterium]MDW8235766.1 tyrosine-type recombinase/integrase [Bacteroidia bacterium]